MNEIRVRYAPSPTGQLHIGGARTALINYLFAKHYNGKFIFRTEDTDLKRNVNDGESSQINDLEWLGIICDEAPVIGGNYGPYRQSERLKLYQKYAQKLLKQKKAYYCFCTPAELKFEREQQISSGQKSPHYSQKCLNLNAKKITQQLLSGIKPTIRIYVSKIENFTWNDLVRGIISVNGAEIGDWVILKNNRIPTYNFAVVIDDYSMDITHIFRGEEHISNTPKQIHLYEVFGWKKPQFGHITLILNENRKKLSKRDETIIQFIVQYRNMGYLPQAIFNFLTLLGWSPVGEKEIFSKKELIKIFDEKRLSKSPSMFDVQKLTWINAQYIKQLSEKEYLNLIIPFAKKAYKNIDFTSIVNQEILKLYQKEITNGAAIKNKLKLFYDSFSLTKDAQQFLQRNDCNKVIISFKKIINDMDTWTNKSISQVIDDVKNTTKTKGELLFMPIRIICSGQMHGPDLKSTLLLLGLEKIKLRLEHYNE